MKLRTASLVGLAGAALVAGAVVAPAQAATATTITVHVQNARKTALKNVEVTAQRGESFVYFGQTNSKGDLTKAKGVEGQLRSGTWRFYLRDVNETRLAEQRTYALKSFTAKITAGQARTFTDKTLQAGSRVSGKVTAPSGRVVKNAELYAFKDAQSRDYVGAVASESNGAYHLFGLPTGTLYIRSFTGGSDLSSARKVTIEKAGSTTKGVSFSKVKVPCSTDISARNGEAFGSVDLSISASAEYFGLSAPGGKLAIYIDDVKVDTVDYTGLTTWSKTYTEQSTGQHTYKVKYTGGDCFTWEDSRAVQVNGAPM